MGGHNVMTEHDIDRAMRPAPVEVEVLKNAKDHQMLRKNQKLKSEHI